MLSLVIFLIFVFVWYFPVWRRQGKTDRLPRWTILKAILLGLIPGFLAIILLQIAAGYLEKALALSGAAYRASDSYISAALVEECVKFLGAWLILRKAAPKRKVDYALIFGAVGLGYEVTETALGLSGSLLGGVIRGVFALHIIWQLWMGLYYYEYRRSKLAGDEKGKRKNFLLAFGVPVLLHGTNDFLAFMAEDSFNLAQAAGESGAEMTVYAVWIGLLIFFMLAQLVFQIITFKKALRAAEESRKLDALPADPEITAPEEEMPLPGETAPSQNSEEA